MHAYGVSWVSGEGRLLPDDVNYMDVGIETASGDAGPFCANDINLFWRYVRYYQGYEEGHNECYPLNSGLGLCDFGVSDRQGIGFSVAFNIDCGNGTGPCPGWSCVYDTQYPVPAWGMTRLQEYDVATWGGGLPRSRVLSLDE